jgi:ADP-ribose pyrophosphatase YjhB (NUDIX family)
MPDFVRSIPQGDDRERLVCPDCGHVDYQNPKIIVGSVVVDNGRVLLCRRAIEPRRGFWTLPAGFLELGETAPEGAAREALEEAQAEILTEGVLALFSLSRIGQVQVIYQARFADPLAETLFAAGPESLDVRLFAWDQIPWSEIAFPSVRWALDAWHGLGGAAPGVPATNPDADPRGERRPEQLVEAL